MTIIKNMRKKQNTKDDKNSNNMSLTLEIFRRAFLVKLHKFSRVKINCAQTQNDFVLSTKIFSSFHLLFLTPYTHAREREYTHMVRIRKLKAVYQSLYSHSSVLLFCLITQSNQWFCFAHKARTYTYTQTHIECHFLCILLLCYPTLAMCSSNPISFAQKKEYSIHICNHCNYPTIHFSNYTTFHQ